MRQKFLSRQVYYVDRETPGSIVIRRSQPWNAAGRYRSCFRNALLPEIRLTFQISKVVSGFEWSGLFSFVTWSRLQYASKSLPKLTERGNPGR
jgi:hypothetical protein